MHILYTCDNNFVWLMGISMISLLENNKNIKDLNIWLIGKDISEENREILSSIANKYSRNITIVDFPDLQIPDSLCSERWPKITFARLFANELLPKNIEQLLYIDCDTIIYGDISQLDSYDMKGNLFCGVRDCIGKKYRYNIGLSKDDLYINAGVLLINTKKLQEFDIRPYLEKTAWEYKDFITYTDQDLLNIAFKNQIGEISPRFNVMTIVASYDLKTINLLRKPEMFYTEKQLINAKQDPRIIHYTTNLLTVRPWYSNTNHPFAEEFRQYLEKSPWHDKVLPEMVFNKTEHKIIKAVNILPNAISNRLLGFLHTTVRPEITKLKAKRGKQHG